MSKRITQSAVNWAALAERVPAEQRVQLTNFKIKSDTYLRRVLANPPEAPKIDWAFYKKNLPIAGMADNFQKQYESMKIAFPVDNLTSQVDAQWKEIQSEIAEFVATSNCKISEYEEKIAHTCAQLPYDQMTLEDFRDAHPELAIDPINNPTFWPHTADEQNGYVDPNETAVATEKH